MQGKNSFKYADAWLLLSIIYASEKKAASLSEIIAYGDSINHAIFTIEELQGGFFRLINSGYIIEHGNKYRVIDTMVGDYKKFVIKNKSVIKQLAFIQKKLNSPAWSEEYDPLTANEDGSYEKINKNVFEVAYKEYYNGPKFPD
ncbi:MAG: hypothetical protein HY810_08730 [Candidatus Omnitrophica bacterium]|nr:hypothetical protein [Candidatus Omnitrophota bacterium]